MRSTRLFTVLTIALIGALLGACGSRPAARATAGATATIVRAQSSGPTPTRIPRVTPTPTSTPEVELEQVGSKSLFILHTNDVIGYTDPCG